MNHWLKSLHNALKGLTFVYRHESNFRIHLAAGVFSMMAGLAFQLSRLEMTVVILLIMAVLGLELINSALEHFLDLIVPRFDVHVERVKNVLAAGVLLVSIGAAVIGVIIFLPHIIKVFTAV